MYKCILFLCFIVAINSQTLITTFGSNDPGSLGDGTLIRYPTPIPDLNISSISAKYHSVGAVTIDGKLYTWGENYYGQLGNGGTEDVSVPTLVNIGSEVKKVAMGMYHSLALTSNGRIYTFGLNVYGQLGDSTYTNRIFPTLIQINVTWSDIAVGEHHSIAIAETGEVYVWGLNVYGQLGLGHTSSKNSPQKLSSGIYKKVAAGKYHSLFLREDGKVEAAGLNNYGQLGDGTKISKAYLVTVTFPGDPDIIDIACGSYHSLALSSTGEIYSFGYNLNGELGDGTTISKENPVSISSPFTFTAINAGIHSSVGILNDGSTAVWGVGRFNAKASSLNEIDDLLVPTKINFSEPIKQIASGSSYILQLNEEGRLYYHGFSHSGTSGLGIDLNQPNPVNVTSDFFDFENITHASIGHYHAAVLTRQNKIYVWGANHHLQLGFLTSPSNVPIPLSKPESISGAKIFSFGFTTMLLTKDGKVYCWGSNSYGQCGIGIASDFVFPSLIDIPKKIKLIGGGEGHSIIVDEDGKPYSFGLNTYGALGDGTNIDRSYPVPVKTDGVLANKTIIQVTGGKLNTMVLCDDGKVYGFGFNYYAALGDGTIIDKYYPVAVDTSGVLKDEFIIKIFTGGHFTIALSKSNKLFSWGHNAHGQLGDGTTTTRKNPVAIDMTPFQDRLIVDIGGGFYHAFAITSKGEVFGWGRNLEGQLGLGHFMSQLTPTLIPLPNRYSKAYGGALFSLLHREYYTCGGVVWDKACNNRGYCKSQDVCVCDPGYHGENCELTCESPSVTSCTFSNDATKIIVKFNTNLDIDFILGKTSGLCKNMFDYNETSNGNLGEMALCTFDDAKTLSIKLGEDRNVVVNDYLKFLPNIVKSLNCSTTFEGTAKIDIPPNAVKPAAILNTPSQISPCSSLTLDASPSTGIRPLKFKYNVNDTNVQSYLNTLSPFTSIVHIPENILPFGGMVFTVTITDAMGITDEFSTMVEKINDLSPITIPRGPTTFTHFQSNDLFLQTSVSVPLCNSSNEFTLNVLWTCISHPNLELPPSKTSNNLYLRANSLLANNIYTFQFTANIIGGKSSSLTFHVEVIHSPVYSIIKGGKERIFPNIGSFQLDGSESYDPDFQGLNPNAVYSWTCYENVDGTYKRILCDIFTSNTRNAIFESRIATQESPFPIDKDYRISLEYRVGTRSSTSSVDIKFKEGKIPQVFISSSLKGNLNFDQPLSLFGRVDSHESSLTYQWEVLEGDVNLLDKRICPLGIDKPQLYISPNSLNSTRYKFQLVVSTVSNGVTIKGSASTIIDINHPPVGGSLIVTPTSGISIQDSFKISTSSWISIDQPMKYLFFYTINGKEFPLNILPQFSEEIIFEAPVVNEKTTCTFKVIAVSKYGVKSQPITFDVEVHPFEIDRPLEEYADWLIENSLKLAEQIGSTENILNSINRISDLIKLIESKNTIKRKQLKTILLKKLKDLDISFINSNFRKSFTFIVIKLLDIIDEIDENYTNNALEVINIFYNVEGQLKQELENIDFETGNAAITSLSNIVLAFNQNSNDTQNTELYEKLIQSLAGISKLLMIGHPIQSKINLNSNSFKIFQTRNIISSYLGNTISLDENANDSPSVTLNGNIFENNLNFIDLRILQLKSHFFKNTSNLISDIISIIFENEEGNEIKIENLDESKEILIKIYSKKVNSNSVCKYFDYKDNIWKKIKVKEIKEGEYIICATNHLSDFATFAQDDEILEKEGFNYYWLAFLGLIPLAGLIIILVTVLIIVKIRLDKRKKSMNIEMDAL